jgi:hypothetical protein
MLSTYSLLLRVPLLSGTAMSDAEANEEFWDRGPGINDAVRCRDCEALVTQEDDLCEVCQSGWIDWLIARDASLHGHILDSAASRPSP